ncbi:hypothetical protein [Bacillus alkalicellulosilyticus]|nr:hypothetical protein [Bacillus alkalicellulosilyticus]
MIEVNTSLATFMKMAIVALTIGTLIFGSLYALMGDISDDIAEYISAE